MSRALSRHPGPRIVIPDLIRDPEAGLAACRSYPASPHPSWIPGQARDDEEVVPG